MSRPFKTPVVLTSVRGVLLLLVLLVLVPLLVVQAAIYATWYRTRWADQENATLDTAREAATTFEAYVRDVRRQESAIGGALTGPHRYTVEQANVFLTTAGQGYSSIRAWSWADPRGTVIASSLSKAIGLKIGDRSYFQDLRGGRPWVVSNLLVDRVTGAHMLVIATRINDGKGALAGVVIANAVAGDLGERAVKLNHPVGEAVAVFDRAGALIYNGGKEPDLFHDWRQKDRLLARALDSNATQLGVITLASGGTSSQEYIAARVPIRDIGWVAGARRPVAQAMAKVYTGLWIAGGLNLLVAAGSGAAALAVSGSLVRQVRRLQSHAEAIGRGDFAHRAAGDGIGELAALADAFNRMSDAVQQARQSLEVANAMLEQRVLERTATLTVTIERLEKTERELRAASLYARGLLEASLDPLVTISPEGKITDVNEAAIKITGMARQQLLGVDFSDCFTEPEKARQGYQRVFAEGFVTDYPLTVRHTGGRLTDVLYNASVYKDAQGNVLGVFAAARDVTERNRIARELDQYRAHLEDIVRERTGQLEESNRQLEQEILDRRRTAEELARSNRELEQFAYVASHDLQEPLRVVTGYVQLIDRKYKGQLDADADQFMHYIVDGVTRMQQLIADLLNYSRVGTRGKPFQTTDLGTVVARAVTNLQKNIEESGASVTYNSLPSVQGDEVQLVQLFQNLIANGIKFRSERTPQIEISARRDGDRWVFAVRDNGIGIERQYWEQIFVLFQRLHTRKKYPGTGIGLAICQRIVERHGGRIWLDSEPGRGTTFYFALL